MVQRCGAWCGHRILFLVYHSPTRRMSRIPEYASERNPLGHVERFRTAHRLHPCRAAYCLHASAIVHERTEPSPDLLPSSDEYIMHQTQEPGPVHTEECRSRPRRSPIRERDDRALHLRRGPEMRG